MRAIARMLAIIVLFGSATGARAEELTCPCPTECCPEDGPYIWSFQFLSGTYPMTGGPTSTSSAINDRINYLPQSFRLGCEYDRVFCPYKHLDGTLEGFVEFNYCPITKMYGNFFTGPGLILRYNFKACDPCLVPYIQAGAGLAFNDVYRDRTQELIGSAVEVLLQGAVGLRYRLTECLSLDVEGGYRHISNPGSGSRNTGINNIGFSLGFTYTFGK